MAKKELKISDIAGAKHLKRVINLLNPLHGVATDPLRPNKRTLHMDEYAAMLLLYMFSPICDSLRCIQRATEIESICKKFGIKRTGLSTLSDAQSVFEASLLEPVIDELYSALKPIYGGNLCDIKSDILLVDGTLIPAVKNMLWAVYRKHSDEKAIKCHFIYNLGKGVPVFTKITDANASEKAVLAALLEPGKCYVLDRGYAKHLLMQQIIDIGSSFVLRIRDNSVLEVIEERELSKESLGAGIVRDVIVKLGTNEGLKSPIRLIEVECTPHKKNGKTGRGGPEQGDTILIATNELDLEAVVISTIYQSRWEIEIFFRHFKHLLGCRHLLSQSENGIRLEMYMAIIACLLIMLWTGKKPNKATLEMLQYFMLGLATEEELLRHIERLKPLDSKTSKKS